MLDLDLKIDGVDTRVDLLEGSLVDIELDIDAVEAEVDVLRIDVARNDAQDVVIAANTTATTNLRSDVVNGRIGLVTVGPDDAVLVASDRAGDVVAFNGTSGNRRLTGIAAGTAANDAATLGQMRSADAAVLQSAIAYTDQSVTALFGELDRMWSSLQGATEELRRDTDRAAAGAAALAGLPQALIPGKGMVVMGVGGHGDQAALAFGIGKAFGGERAPVLRAGIAFDLGSGSATYNAAVGFHF